MYIVVTLKNGIDKLLLSKGNIACMESYNTHTRIKLCDGRVIDTWESCDEIEKQLLK